MAERKQTVSVEGFGDALDELLNDFLHETMQKRDEALEAGANVLIGNLEAESPRGETGDFAKNWTFKKYGKTVYVHNKTLVYTKAATGRNGKRVEKRYRDGVPLSNLLEFSEKHGKPFVRRTTEASENEIYNAMRKKLDGGN